MMGMRGVYERAFGFAVEALLAFPLLLTLAMLPFGWIPPGMYFTSLALAYAAGLLIRRLLLRFRRLLPVLIGMLFSVAMGWLLGRSPVSQVALGVFIFLIYIRGLSSAEGPWAERFPKALYFVGLLSYSAAYFFYSRLAELLEYRYLITLGGLAATLVSFISINSDVLSAAAQQDLRDTASRPVIKRHNRRLILGVYLFILLIAGFRPLMDGFHRMMTALSLLIARIVEQLFARLYTTLPHQPSGDPDFPPLLPSSEASTPSVIGEFIVQAVGYALLTLALLAFVCLILRLIWRLGRLIYQLILKLLEVVRSTAAYSGYEDEKESLMDWESIKNGTLEGLQSLLARLLAREPKWANLTDDGQRIRFLYRLLLLQLIRRGYAHQAALTPAETLRTAALLFGKDSAKYERLAFLYGEARYGQDPVQALDLAMLYRWIENQERSKEHAGNHIGGG